MGRKSRDKGARGEREFLSLCRRRLGLKNLRRNLEQTQVGGADAADGLAGFCLEIKRTAQWEERFWQQAVRQAADRCEAPALAHKHDRGRWLVTIRAAELGVETVSGRLTLEAGDWLAVVKSRLVSDLL